MLSIDIDSIMDKAMNCAKAKSFQNKVKQKGSQNAHIPIEAAEKFIQTMVKTVEACGAQGTLGSTAAEAASELEYSKPYKVGTNRYKIGVSFSGGLHRDSLRPERYDGVDNIVALLNNGYAAHNVVYGDWRGDRILSRRVRAGAHFVETALANFMRNYGRTYGVEKIEVSEDFR